MYLHVCINACVTCLKIIIIIIWLIIYIFIIKILFNFKCIHAFAWRYILVIIIKKNKHTHVLNNLTLSILPINKKKILSIVLNSPPPLPSAQRKKRKKNYWYFFRTALPSSKSLDFLPFNWPSPTSNYQTQKLNQKKT